MDSQEKLLEIYMAEYTRLKEEQLQRITFRDVTIPFSTFLIIGSTLSAVFAESSKSLDTYGYYLLLLIPWICLSLGWSYLANDEKISTIGAYFKSDLKRKITSLNEFGDVDIESIFGWEIYHKNDTFNKGRKWFQYIVNLITFFFSGVTAVGVFILLKGFTSISLWAQVMIVSELVFLFILAIWISIYSFPISFHQQAVEENPKDFG